MAQIVEFVYDPTSDQKLVFQISSNGLKKALSKQIQKEYMNTGLFCEYVRGQCETAIKKSKSFKQSLFLRGVPKETKLKKKTSINDLGFCVSSDDEKVMQKQEITKLEESCIPKPK